MKSKDVLKTNVADNLMKKSAGALMRMKVDSLVMRSVGFLTATALTAGNAAMMMIAYAVAVTGNNIFSSIQG